MYNVAKEVQIHFADIITEYEFQVHSQSKGYVKLRNSHCGIYIGEERGGEIWVEFEDLKGDQFQIKSLINMRGLVKACNALSRDNIFNFWAQVIGTYFQDILNGDFTWRERYHSYTEEMKTLVGAVHSLEYEHPIYRKFCLGDSSWKQDIRAYLENQK